MHLPLLCTNHDSLCTTYASILPSQAGGWDLAPPSASDGLTHHEQLVAAWNGPLSGRFGLGDLGVSGAGTA